jgi:hypothetical protein
MLLDGLILVEGSTASNLVIASGSSFPSSADLGELFYRSDLSQLSIYNGSTWTNVSSVGGLGTVTSLGISSSDLAVSGSPVTSSGTITLSLNTIPISKGGTGATTTATAINNLLPAQTANSQKFLKTDGTNVSWGVVTTATVYVGTSTGDVSAVEGNAFYADGTGDSAEGLHVYSGGNWIQVTGAGSIPSGLFTADVEGDVTGTIVGGDTATLTLATSGVVAGTYTKVTVDEKGRVTTATTLDAGDIPSLAGTYLTGNETISLSGDATGSGSTSISLTLANSGVAAGTYGTASAVPTVTVDAKGRLTSATATNIAIAASQITSGTLSDSIVASSNVTQHQASLTIAETQITDGALLARVGSSETISGTWTFNSPVTVGTPVSGSHAATKDYVDNTITGLDMKASVRVATTGNITLSGTQTIDGVAVVAGNRVLVKDQTVAADNGIYVVAAGSWSRASDADNTPDGEVTSGMYAFVEEGTTNADSGWVLSTNNPISLGITTLTFVQFNGLGQVTAGAGLTKTGNTVNVVSASADRVIVNADSIDLATTGTAGTYAKVTTDAYGRVVSGGALSAGDIPSLSSTYQPLDADLTAIAGLAGTSGLLKKTGVDSWSLDTSTYLTGNESISVSGDATGSGSTSIALTLANSGVVAGSYTKVTVDAKGRVTTATSITAGDIPSLASTYVLKAGDTVTGTLTGTNFHAGAGTTSSPSISFSADTNTGIYNPAADTLAFVEGGVESMRIDSAGNVAIGTSTNSLGHRLMVYGASPGGIATQGVDYLFAVKSTATASYLGFNQNTIAVSGATPLLFGIGVNEAMRIDSSGNVGVGTSSPSAKLHVGGHVSATSVFAATTLSVSSSGQIYLPNAWTTSSGHLVLKNGTDFGKGNEFHLGYFPTPNDGSEAWLMLYGSSSATLHMAVTDGNMMVGTTAHGGNRLTVAGTATTTALRIGSGSTSSPSLSFLDDFATGIFKPTTTTLGFSTNGGERMRIDSSGFVGIGTTAPTQRLHVIGTATMSAISVGYGSNPSPGIASFTFGHGPQYNLEMTGTSRISANKSSSTFIVAYSDNGGANASGFGLRNLEDTWMFSPYRGGTGTVRPLRFATNTWGDSTTGVALTIETNSNVGIGTSTVNARLDVYGGDALINGVTVGRGVGGQDNIALGTSALAANTTGIGNVAVGRAVLMANTTGTYNTAVGYDSLKSNTSGTNNVAVGPFTLLLNKAGWANTAVGANAMQANTTGSNNVAIGHLSMYANTGGSYNSAIGRSALYANTSGYENSALGFAALLANTIGYHNVAVGTRSLQTNTSGYRLTVLGTDAMNKNTTGHSSVAVGYASQYNNLTGEQNVSIGRGSLYANASGSWNVAIGQDALYYSSGTNNFGIGYLSGADALLNITTESNQGVIGNNSTTNITAKVAITVPSDIRDKTEIAPVTLGLGFVNSVNPISYRFKKSRDSEEAVGRKILGFSAQELLPLQGDATIIDASDANLLKFNSQDLIAVLFKAVKELSTEIEILKAKIDNKE